MVTSKLCFEFGVSGLLASCSGLLEEITKSLTRSKSCMEPAPEAPQPGKVPKPGALSWEGLQDKVESYGSKRRVVTL